MLSDSVRVFGLAGAVMYVPDESVAIRATRNYSAAEGKLSEVTTPLLKDLDRKDRKGDRKVRKAFDIIPDCFFRARYFASSA
jgi:hypothetical protein